MKNDSTVIIQSRFTFQDYFDLISFVIDHYEEIEEQLEMHPKSDLVEAFTIYKNVMQKIQR